MLRRRPAWAAAGAAAQGLAACPDNRLTADPAAGRANDSRTTMHDLTIILTLAGGLGAALLMGWLTQRLGLSTLVGYMLAGIIVGPYTPGFVDRKSVV